MIKSKDLRIGNYITDIWSENKTPFQVKEIKERVCIYGSRLSAKYEHLKPIPLTEDLLLKCGFNKKHGSIGWDEFRLENVRIALAPTNKGKIPSYSVGEDYILIKYLHELQNLYYALTGKELEVKI